MDTPTQRTDSGESAPYDLLSLPHTLGDYELLAVLGHGGMGVVYRARHRSLQSLAAVKVLNAAVAHHPTARQRFLQEARVTAALRHDGVVRVVHVGEAGPVLYLVMELLEGESLAARLRHGPPVAMADAARIGREVAAALAEAHRHNLVHRDVKPGNIFLEARDGFPPRAKLLDFGIARCEDSAADLTSLNALLGTPQYMAPEQANDSRVGTPADVFSLGCVLYELAAGDNPFRAGSHAAVLRKVAEYDPPPLKQVQPALPEALSSLVRDCLRKDPAGRPPAGDVERRLAQIETDPESVTWLQTVSRATDPTETRTLLSAESRARRWRFPALALALALAGVVGIGLWFGPSPRRESNGPTPEASPPLADEDKTQAVLNQWKVEDPPPLDEWLRGRRIRTVRQGGGAEFESIRAALEAVRSGEAVEILDAGPYTDLSSFPDGSVGLAVPKSVTDVGIFSRRGATVRVTKYVVNKDIPPQNGRVCYGGATIEAGSGLRLHGLTFQAGPPPEDTADASAWRLFVGGPCVVEDCLWLRARRPRPEEHLVILSLSLGNAAPIPLTVRRCWLEGTMKTHALAPGVRADARVENCVFTDAAQNLWLELGHARWAFVGNVFQADDCCVALGTTRFGPKAGQPEVLFGRNTVLSAGRSPLRVERYEKGDLAPVSVSLFDNAFSSPDDAIHFVAPQDARESRAWASGGNWSSGRSGATWLNFLEGRMQLASQDPLAAGFARVVNVPPANGAGGPRPPGAAGADDPPSKSDWLPHLQARRRAAVP